MALIGSELYFNFNGKSSKDFNLVVVHVGGGMFDDSLLASRTANVTRPRGRNRVLLQGVEEEVLTFTLELGFKKDFTKEDVEKTVMWLRESQYRPLFFENQPDRVYNAMFVSDSRIIHNGLNQGYLTLNVETDSPHIFSPYKLTDKLTVVGNGTITIPNNGHEIVLPEISILKNGNGKITIVNETDDGNIFELSNLTNGEDLYLDCYRETIETDIVGVYHYSDYVGHFPKLLLGNNTFSITGDCEITFRYKEEYIF